MIFYCEFTRKTAKTYRGLLANTNCTLANFNNAVCVSARQPFFIQLFIALLISFVVFTQIA